MYINDMKLSGSSVILLTSLFLSPLHPTLAHPPPRPGLDTPAVHSGCLIKGGLIGLSSH